MWLLTALAFAAPDDRFPYRATVEIPAEGPQRIRVPAELRPAWSDETGLMVVDASGSEVPFASLVTDSTPTRIQGKRGTEEGELPLEFWPSADGVGWELAVRERPADGLEIRLPRTPFATTARVFEREEGAWVPVAEQVVWRLDRGAASAPVPLPRRTGVFKVVLDPGAVEPGDAPSFDVVRYAHTQIPVETVTLNVTSQQVPATGWVRYEVALPQPLAADWVEIETDSPLFSRGAAAEFVVPADAPDELPREYVPYTTQTVQRTSLGGARIDQVRIRPEGAPTRRLAVYVEADGADPLPIDRVTLGMAGFELLVQDAGEGPHTLYAGGPSGTTAPSDLQFVAPELARLAGDAASPGPREPNPSYVPPETRGGLDGPSTPIDLADHSLKYPVEGPAGLVRIALTDEVLAAARPDLADLRLIDSEGRQIPYFLQDDGQLHSWGELPFERNERGQQSVLEVTLPEPNVMVGVVTLSTDAPLFDRTLRLSRPAAGRLETMRAFQWRGADRPTTVTVGLNRRVGDTLVVQIDNGDDPPLPITAIEAAWQGWEVVAVVPEGGASLVVGAPRLEAPDYDLWLLRDQLRDRAVSQATLGEPEVLTAPPLSRLDRGLVAFGVAIMVLGLLGLTIVLVRGAPEEAPEPEPEPEPGEEDEAPPSDPGDDEEASDPAEPDQSDRMAS